MLSSVKKRNIEHRLTIFELRSKNLRNEQV